MKKLVFLFGILFALQTALFAQDTIVVFNAHLLSTFQLNVVDGDVQEITFDDPTDYNVGVYGPHDAGNQGILPGFSDVTVEATENWYFTIEAENFQGYAGPNGAGTGEIPIENLGVWCDDFPGAGHDLNDECLCDYQDAGNAMGITVAPQTLIYNGTGNAGTIEDNHFFLNWLMGTGQGTMKSDYTMLEQLTGTDPATTFSTGDFTTTAYLTLIPTP